MKRLRYLTAGESHGPALVGILEGMIAGLPLRAEDIDRDLHRRQQGFGRGGRMKIEKDQIRILSGVRYGETLGSPIALHLPNLDFENWKERMQIEPVEASIDVSVPRPGHADLAGALKYGHRDLRNVLERASARETAMRVALGGVARVLLESAGIRVGSYVIAVHNARGRVAEQIDPEGAVHDAEGLALRADRSPVRCLDPEAEPHLIRAIEGAQARRDTVGGIFEVRATGVPIGLGSHVHWDRKLDAALAETLMSLQAIKGVSIGAGFEAPQRYGSELHDPILPVAGRLERKGNSAGGIEGGISNGQPIVITAAMKPLSTVPNSLPSVDLLSGKVAPAPSERSDTCAVPAAAVVGEALVCLVLADALLEKLGGDSLSELRRSLHWVRRRERRGIGHVWLTGLPGAGKTEVGPLLAARLGLRAADLDQLIETEAHDTVQGIFSREGEEGFRRREAAALARVAEGPPAVVALGAGALGAPTSRDRVQKTGTQVHLQAPLEELNRRLGAAVRPMLGDPSPEGRLERLASMQRERNRWYERAEVSVDTSSRSPGAVSEELAIRLLALERE
jgi:chorismate synthase